MDPRLQKRIMLFNLGGIINAFLGLFLLIEGAPGVAPTTRNWLLVFFFAFAAVDFWFARAIRRKWEQDRARQAAASDPATGP